MCECFEPMLSLSHEQVDFPECKGILSIFLLSKLIPRVGEILSTLLSSIRTATKWGIMDFHCHIFVVGWLCVYLSVFPSLTHRCIVSKKTQGRDDSLNCTKLKRESTKPPFLKYHSYESS